MTARLEAQALARGPAPQHCERPGLRLAAVRGRGPEKPVIGSDDLPRPTSIPALFAATWRRSIFRDGVMWNLNALIPPAPFVLRTALGFDAEGRILCTDGQVGQAESGAYLLTPL